MKLLFITFQPIQWAQALFGLLCVMAYSVGAEPLELLFNGKIIVDAKANIYGANQTKPPAPSGGGGGILPPVIQLPRTEGQLLLRFPSITGQVKCTNAPFYNEADGGDFCLEHTLLQFEPSGLSSVNYQKTMFLVGVFTTDAQTKMTTAPLPTDFYSANQQMDFMPQLYQVFFIGNGRNYQNQLQTFRVPVGATRFFLGFADGNDKGQVGFYDDNQGQLEVELEVYQPQQFSPTNYQGYDLELLAHDEIIVDAKANIYGAGQTEAPAPAGGGGGLLPPMISLPAREYLVLHFPNISGEVSCAYDQPYYNEAEGGDACMGHTSEQI